MPLSSQLLAFNGFSAMKFWFHKKKQQPKPKKNSQIRNTVVVTAKFYIKFPTRIVAKTSMWHHLLWLSAGISNLTMLRTDHGSWTQCTLRIPLGVFRGTQAADPSTKYIHPTFGEKKPLSTRKNHQCPPLRFCRESCPWLQPKQRCHLAEEKYFWKTFSSLNGSCVSFLVTWPVLHCRKRKGYPEKAGRVLLLCVWHRQQLLSTSMGWYPFPWP